MYKTDEQKAKEAQRQRLRAEVEAANKYKLGATGLLVLCRVCSLLSQAIEPNLKDFTKTEQRVLKRLVKDKLVDARYTGRLFPTNVGFFAVGNLAPIPMHLKTQQEEAMKD